VPPYASFPAPGDDGTIDVVTRTSPSVHVAPSVDGRAAGAVACALDAVVAGAVGLADAAAVEVGVDGVDGGLTATDDPDGALGAGALVGRGAPEFADGPPLDGWEPHEYTISRITISNPPTTIARRRQ
jgi:hypothetical protein